MKYIAAVIACAVLAYLCGAFIQASFDFTMWPMGERKGVIIAAGVAAIFLGLGIWVSDTHNKGR